MRDQPEEEKEICALAENLNAKIVALISDTPIYEDIGLLVDARKAVEVVVDRVSSHFFRLHSMRTIK